MKRKEFAGLLKSLSEARAHAAGKKVKGVRVHVPAAVDVVAIRESAGMTQSEFSDHIGVSVATLRNWEQRRRSPEGPARVLLAILAKDPRIVSRMLKGAA